jgi:predicted DNA-binding transcriptional regulator YafY
MPKDLSSIRIARLNDLVSELSTHGCLPRKELMARLEYTQGRTLERDLAYLRDQYGVEIEYDRHKGAYRLRGTGRFVAVFDLTEREVTALSAGLGMASHFLPHLQDECESLWGKVRFRLPAGLSDHGERLGQSAVVALPVSPMDPKVFETCLNAIRQSKAIRIRYRSPYGDGSVKPYELSPWGVFFRAHAWYLWAGHPISGETRTFRISRISQVVMEEREMDMTPPAAGVGAFAMSAWYACPGEPCHKVKVRVTPPLADVVAETPWHVSQSLFREPGGTLLLSANVPDLDEVARWVMASSPYAEVLEPPALRDRIRDLANTTAGRHLNP